MPRLEVGNKRVPNRISHPHLDEAEFAIVMSIYAGDNFGTVPGDKKNCVAACVLQDTTGVEDAWVAQKRTFVQFADNADRTAPAAWRKAARKAGQRLGGALYVFQNPAMLYAVVQAFDFAGAPFPPGDYRLTPLSPSDRAGAREMRAYGTGSAKQHPKGANRPNKPKRKPTQAVQVRNALAEAGVRR